MFARIIAKEWKEKFSLFIFGLLGLAAFVLSFSIYAQNKEVLDILAATVILIFLPIFSLLLGATGFSSELRDDAWAYLFSRPVRKWQIWIAKYVSLLSLLVVFLAIFALLTTLHPALRSARDVVHFPLGHGQDVPFWVLPFVLPLFLFTVAFSFSVLSDKSHVVVFLSGLTAFSLQAALTLGVSLAIFAYWWFPGFGLRFMMSLLILLSMAGASVLTMSKADFSQPGRRVWVFTKFAVLFLAVSLGFGAIWTFVSMSIHRNPYVSSPEVWGGAAYFATDRGVFRFDASSGQKQRIAKIPARWGNVSIGGQRILFWKYRIVRIKGKLRQFEELWIADAEGKGAKPLVRTSQEDSPLFGASIYPTAISPTGDKVVFVARWGQRQIGRDLWCINADGTGLKGYAIGLARDGYNAILGFLEEDRDVLVADAARGKDAWLKGSRLLKVNLETGKAEILTENAHGVQLQPGPDSGGSSRLIAFVFSAGGEPAKELRLIDPRTLEQREIYRADSLSGFRWSQAGDKLAFSVGRSVLGIYSLAEDTITQIKDLPEFDLRWPPYSLDWVPGGELVLKKFNKGAATLCVMDGNLMERKSYAFPFISYHPTELRGADHYVLVRDSERSQIWGLDLKTERWQRIY